MVSGLPTSSSAAAMFPIRCVIDLKFNGGEVYEGRTDNSSYWTVGPAPGKSDAEISEHVSPKKILSD